MGDVATAVLCSLACNEKRFRSFCELYVLRTRARSQLRVHRVVFSLPTNECRPAHPSPSHIPHQEHPSFSRAVVSPARSRSSCPQVKCKRLARGVVFRLILCTPKFDQFRPISTPATPQSRGVRPLLRTWGRSISIEITQAAVMEPLSSHRRCPAVR